jgi:hypothetical protein
MIIVAITLTLYALFSLEEEEEEDNEEEEEDDDDEVEEVEELQMVDVDIDSFSEPGRKFLSKVWKKYEPICVDGVVVAAECKHCARNIYAELSMEQVHCASTSRDAMKGRRLLQLLAS